MSRRVRTCIEYGFLGNLETSKGPSKLEIGDELPDYGQILPCNWWSDSSQEWIEVPAG